MGYNKYRKGNVKVKKLIVAIIMVVTPFITIAQQTQTPINITTLAAQPSPAQFTSYAGLNATFNFETQNTQNANFCAASTVYTPPLPNGTFPANNCNLATAQSGPYPLAISNTRWGTYKLNNPHAFDGPVSACSPNITFNGLVYCLLEFHFHGPSEHWVNNSATDLEVHFVYYKQNDVAPPYGLCNPDSLLVLGQRMVGGYATNTAWANIFSAIPYPPNNTGSMSGNFVSFNIASMMGISNFNTAPSYRYSGGLTAPIGTGTLSALSTCVADTNPNNGHPWWGNPQNQLTTGQYPQIVSWVLFKQPIQLSTAQVLQFKSVFPDGNARAVQPNTGATIYYANPN